MKRAIFTVIATAFPFILGYAAGENHDQRGFALVYTLMLSVVCGGMMYWCPWWNNNR